MREIRDLDTVELILEAQGIFDAIRGTRVIDAGTMRALQQSGNYVTGYFDDGRMVGASVAFFSLPENRTMHSHITALLPEFRGRGWGRELKEHQRQWALSRGVGNITWTFDPLVARNARFYLGVLGSRVTDYQVNQYGIFGGGDAGDESDRLDVKWSLADVAHQPAEASVIETIAIPDDVEKLREDDPSAAHEWRMNVRREMAVLTGRGLRVAGFDPDRGYLFVTA